MKYMKYLFALLLVTAFVSCTKDPVETPALEDQQLRDALLRTDAIGVYQNAKGVFVFDKTEHQLYVAPSQSIVRIQNDAGAQSVELRMVGMPTTEASVKATLVVSGLELSLGNVNEVILLKSENNKLWIWSASTKVGFIMPWISE